MSELTGSKASNPLSDPTPESIAEEFADYFIDKIDKYGVLLRSMTNTTPPT